MADWTHRELLTREMSAVIDFTNPALRNLAIVVAFLFTGLVMTTCFVLFKISGLRRDLRVVRKGLQARKSATDTKSGFEDCLHSISQLSSGLDAVRIRLEMQERSSQANTPAWPNDPPPIQLNRRGQILRLASKGKSVLEIASDLSVSRGEVELLLKVHDLNQSIPETEDSRSAL